MATSTRHVQREPNERSGRRCTRAFEMNATPTRNGKLINRNANSVEGTMRAHAATNRAYSGVKRRDPGKCRNSPTNADSDGSVVGSGNRVSVSSIHRGCLHIPINDGPQK